MASILQSIGRTRAVGQAGTGLMNLAVQSSKNRLERAQAGFQRAVTSERLGFERDEADRLAESYERTVADYKRKQADLDAPMPARGLIGKIHAGKEGFGEVQSDMWDWGVKHNIIDDKGETTKRKLLRAGELLGANLDLQKKWNGMEMQGIQTQVTDIDQKIAKEMEKHVSQRDPKKLAQLKKDSDDLKELLTRKMSARQDLEKKEKGLKERAEIAAESKGWVNILWDDLQDRRDKRFKTKFDMYTAIKKASKKEPDALDRYMSQVVQDMIDNPPEEDKPWYDDIRDMIGAAGKPPPPKDTDEIPQATGDGKLPDDVARKILNKAGRNSDGSWNLEKAREIAKSKGYKF
jgi:hypothetical protein